MTYQIKGLMNTAPEDTRDLLLLLHDLFFLTLPFFCSVAIVLITRYDSMGGSLFFS